MPGPLSPKQKKELKEALKPVLPVPSQYINYDNFLEVRPGHLHAGEDFATPSGTPIYATEDGIATQRSDPSGYGLYLDLDVGKYVIRYAHLSNITKTGHVKKGQVIGRTGNSGSSQGPHLHFEVRTDGGGFGSDGVISPESYLTGAADPGGGIPPSQGGSGGAASGAFNLNDIFAVGRAAAFASHINLPGVLNTAEAVVLTGKKSIYNDDPLLPFIEQLCKGSLRHFMSLPDGSFFAFFADYFGQYGRKPYWAVDDIEIIDGSIDLSDEAFASHVFIPGDTTGLLGGGINEVDRIFSTGVFTIFDFFVVQNKIGKEKGKHKDLKTKVDANEVLQRYGQRPHYEEAAFIRNHIFEAFYAFTQFQLLWSRQFLTTFSLTFMPELYPGGIVHLKQHKINLFIDSVTHEFDYESGFTTTANFSAPSGGKNSPYTQDLSTGLVQFGALRSDDKDKGKKK